MKSNNEEYFKYEIWKTKYKQEKGCDLFGVRHSTFFIRIAKKRKHVRYVTVLNLYLDQKRIFFFSF